MVKLIPTRHPLVSDKSESESNRLLSGYSCDDGALTEDAVDGPEDSSWDEERSTGGARRSPVGLLSAIEEACVLSWPRDEKELTGYLAENDLYALTLRKGFREMEMRLREGHRLKWMNATWEEMMDAIPMHIYEAKNKNLVSLEDSLKWFSKWCKHQNIQEHELVENVHMVMNRMAPKKNCICFYGPPNSGKTWLARSICESVVYYCNISTMTGNSSFEFAEAQLQRAILLNEPCCTDKTVELVKNLLEGERCTIQIKHKSDQSLERTPILIATNQPLAAYTTHRKVNEEAFKVRMIRYDVKAMAELKDCPGSLHPRMWRSLFDAYVANFQSMSANELFTVNEGTQTLCCEE